MQYFILLIGIVILHKVTCDVVAEINVEKDIKFENETKNSSEYYDRLEEDNNNYLDDMIMMLKTHNWTIEEKPCLNDIHVWIRSLRNFTLWAVWGKLK